MKAAITAFIEQLTLPDYILFGSSILLFILLLILAILLRNRLVLAILFILFAFSVIVLGPTVGYHQLRSYLYKHDTNLTEVKALEFTEALLVQGSLTNRSKRDFNACEITANVYKVAHNPVLDLLFPLSPFKKSSIVKKDIPKGKRINFKLFVEPFRYTKDYNVSIGATCR